MTLAHLKQALAKLDPDMEDSAIFLITTHGPERAYSLLAAVGYIVVEGTAYISLISDSEVRKQLLKE